MCSLEILRRFCSEVMDDGTYERCFSGLASAVYPLTQEEESAAFSKFLTEVTDRARNLEEQVAYLHNELEETKEDLKQAERELWK